MQKTVYTNRRSHESREWGSKSRKWDAKARRRLHFDRIAVRSGLADYEEERADHPRALGLCDTRSLPN